MKTKLFLFSALISTMILTFISCKKDKVEVLTKVYPKSSPRWHFLLVKKRVVNANNNVTMGFTAVGPGGVKGEIYIDDCFMLKRLAMAPQKTGGCNFWNSNIF
ncbi:hypothetical protein ABIE26_003509 [Pedobacter africanus]|uniref:Uncharacterized protein n=1 Tax=Pedobacter africanus TaxID=151894 RepID=A0ACC6L0K5_9SPHI|nr:hypothetical protein [Pedobacter africanus]MDR6784863.1 hypothetical protein [Pedobacter africanus]